MSDFLQIYRSLYRGYNFYYPGALKTSSTKTYTTGDDGSLQLGRILSKPRYIDLLDNTVIDRLTNIQWIKNPYAISAVFGSVGSPITHSPFDWIDIATNFSYVGFSDWKLPNIKQMLSICVYGTRDDNNSFYGNNLPGTFWSSTPRPAPSAYPKSSFIGIQLQTVRFFIATPSNNYRAIFCREVLQ